MSVLVKGGAASPSGSGLKSVVTEPLTQFGDFGTIWRELIGLLQVPPKQFALRESKCVKESESVFTVTKFLDGKVLQKIGKGTAAGQDEESILKYSIDPAVGSIQVETRGKGGNVRDRDWCVLHKDGLCLEWWGETPGARKSGAAKAKQLQKILDAVIKQACPGANVDVSKTQVAPDAVSPGGSGLKSAVSSVLDKFVDFETLWSGCVEECKAGAEVQAVSAEEFTAVFMKDTARVTVKYKINKAKGEIYAEHFGPLGRRFEQTWIMIHRSPLRMEHWGEATGERKSGQAKAAYVQTLVDSIALRVKPASSGPAKVHPNSASPSGSGLLSVVSEPLGKFTNFDKLWDNWVMLQKNPPKVPEVKSREVVVVSDTEFKVFATLDEATLVANTPGRKMREDERNFIKYSLNSAKGQMSQEMYGSRGRVRERNFAVLHKNPLRLEWWGETPGERKFGSARASWAVGMLESILKKAGSKVQAVKVQQGVASPTNAAFKSAVSEPLDQHISYERLWAEMIDLLQYPPSTAENKYSPPAVTNDNEFEVKQESKAAGESTLRHSINNLAGEVRIETYGKAGRIRDRNWVVLHKNPLRLEVWGESPGERKHGPVKSAMVNTFLETLVKKVNPQAAPVKVNHGVESPTIAGLKSVISEPMDHVVTYDKFWKEFVHLLKNPITEEGGVKESKCSGTSDSDFTVSQVISPTPLKETSVYKVNKAQGSIYAETSGPDGRLQEKHWTKIHKEPLVIECWSENQITRRFGPARRQPMQGLVDNILKRVAPSEPAGKVKVDTNVKLSSCVSGDLGKFMSYERLWTEIVHLSQLQPRVGPVKTTQLFKKSETEFKVVQTLQAPAKGKGKGKGKGKAAPTTTATLEFRLNPKKGEIYRESYGQLGRLTEKVWTYVRKGPLRLESYAESPGTRRYGSAKAAKIQSLLDQALAMK
jgi:hypothetical protein